MLKMFRGGMTKLYESYTCGQNAMKDGMDMLGLGTNKASSQLLLLGTFVSFS